MIKKLLVIKSKSLEEQLKELGVVNYLDLKRVKDVIETQYDYYIENVEDGTDMLGKSPDNCDKIFAEQGRRGLTIYEGLALLRDNPDILKDHWIDLSGSRYDSDGVPCLDLDVGGPRLDCSCSGNANSRYGSASCGSKLETGDLETLETLPNILIINGIKYEKISY
ncbi:DUF5701 family protein [bacterium]|nr:DUF5701 family protein [bacterium]